MKLRIIWIGRTKDPNLAELSQQFTSRIRRFLPVEITELKDSKSGGDQRRIHVEGQQILEALQSADRVIVLDPGGTLWTSSQLAAFIGRHLDSEPRRLTFVVGGRGGISEAVKKRADRLWSLSPLTFTHEMTRVILLEQIYRALAALRGLPYAK